MIHESRTRTTLALAAASALLFCASLAQAHGQRARLDTNGDGSVDLAEIQAAKPDFTVEQFNKADGNGDGLLSRDELRAAHGRARFERLDQDGSGGVSLDELKAVKPGVTAEHFGKLDANGDGQVSQEEMRAMRQERQRRHAERKAKQPAEG
ncbi:MAG TPA: EF-hand domain-containing protein [Steroidobacteraceae bacterium]|jgi:hypothetical protein